MATALTAWVAIGRTSMKIMNCGENHDCSSELTGRVSILSMVRLVSEVSHRRSIIGRTGRRSTCRCVRVEQPLLTVSTRSRARKKPVLQEVRTQEGGGDSIDH